MGYKMGPSLRESRFQAPSSHKAASSRNLVIKLKSNINAWAALVSAEMFLQKDQLTGPSRSADGPFV